MTKAIGKPESTHRFDQDGWRMRDAVDGGVSADRCSLMSEDQFPRAVVGAAVLDEHGRLFLMQSAGKFGNQWIIPGGKIQRGERAVDALKREFREETGLVIDGIEFVGMRELIEPSRHFVCLEFLARANSTQKITLNEEAVDGGWFTADELKTLDIVPLTKLLIEEELIAKKRMS